MPAFRIFLATLCCASCALPQTAHLQPAAEVRMPILSDSSSPAYWAGGTFYLFQSGELATPDSIRPPLRFQGTDLAHLGGAVPSSIPGAPMSVWIESTWLDSNGRLYAWYHREPSAGCPDPGLRLPEIGALRSDDNGATFTDLGVILRAPADVDCSARNGFFAGGNGDFSVLPDRAGGYFYILFTSYAGPADQQGVGIARIALADRDAPVGKVWKYRSGQWLEPGLGGQLSPVFPAAADWRRSDTDSFWGPSLHYNSYLDTFVVLMNRSCCSPGFPQEGIYVAYNRDLGNPAGWSAPTRVWAGSKQGLMPSEWYGQVLGAGPGESDKLAGQSARFFVAGTSDYEIVFTRPPVPVTIATGGSLPAGVTGAVYSTTLSASGGTPPYRWSAPSGTLPPGLALDAASGTIAGTPGAAGTFGFTAQATDSAGASGSQAFTIVVAPAPDPLRIGTPTELPAGSTGAVYLVTLAAAGGVPPYRWSVISGALPPGLQLTGAGVLSGSATAPGTFSFTAQVSDAAANTSRQTFTVAFSATPVLADTPVLNAASYQPAAAPGSIVSLFGAELAMASQSATAEPLPVNLNGTGVTINGIPAPLFYVSPTQINAQIPFEAPPGPASVVVHRGNQASAARSVVIALAAPGIFTTNQTGTGTGLVVHASNYSLVSATAPAHAGEYVILYCTGLGALQTPVRTGDVPGSPAPQTAGQVTVTFGGVPATVSFAGAAPGFVGLYQVNVRIAEATPAGSAAPVQIQVNGVPGNLVTVAIQ